MESTLSPAPLLAGKGWRARPLAVAAVLLFASPLLANEAPVVDDFRASSTAVLPGGIVTLNVDAHDPDCPSTCTSGCGQYILQDLTRWTATGGQFVREDNGVSASPYSAEADWEAPVTEGTYTVTVQLDDSGSFLCGGKQRTTASLDILVTNNPNAPPVVDSLTADPTTLFPAETSDLTCLGSDPDGDPVSYSWTADSGTVTPGLDGEAVFTASDPGVATVTCTVTDPVGAFGSDTVAVSVVGALGEKALASGLVSPQRLAVAADGSVYVVDPDGGGITATGLFGGRWIYRVAIPEARAVDVDWNGNLLVGRADRAEVVTPRGLPLLVLDPGEPLADVSDVVADTAGRRYGVLHRSAGRVVIYDENGARIASFGGTGDGPGLFKSPQGLAVRPDGNWVVADSGHGEIKVLDQTGNSLLVFGGLGGGVGEFITLDDVEVGSDGIIYASDSFQDWIQAFNPDGSPRETLGTYGSAVGEFKTAGGIALAEGFDRLLAASTNGAAVQVFITRSDPVPAGPEAVPGYAPTALDFFSQPVGTTSTPQTVNLSNSGGAPLGVRAVALPGDFAQTNDCGAYVEPGGACAFQVSFIPHAVGGVQGSMVIDTSADNGALVVTLSGSGFIPQGARLSPPRYEFADQLVDTVSDERPILLTNTGTAPLQIVSIGTTGDYRQSNDCGGALAGGASCTVSVAFAPLSVADHLPGSLVVETNAADSPHSAELDGRGIVYDPDIRIADASIAEGDGQSASADFVVTLSQVSGQTVTVDYRTVDETAVAGADYEAVSGTLAFDPGQVSRTLSVPVLGDLVLEPDEETFRLELSNPIQGVLRNATGLGTILDDERCAGRNLMANPGGEAWPSGGTIPGWTALAGDWQRRGTDPTPYEDDWYLFAGASDYAELIQDVDVSAFATSIDAESQIFFFDAFVRTADEAVPDRARVVVEYRNWDNTLVLDAFDSSEVWSPAGWARIVDERVAPRGTSWIRVRLLATRLSGTDNDVFVDDVSLRSLRAPTLTVEDTSMYEGVAGTSGELLFPVMLPCPYHLDVAASYATADGTATGGEDYLPQSGWVDLPSGQTVSTVTVPFVGDDQDEPHETVELSVELSSPGEVVELDPVATGTLVNDDFCPQGAADWAADPGGLPVEFLEIGDVEYGTADLLLLLSYSGPNVPSQLARQLVATKLNLAVGSDPWIVPTVEEADLYLTAWPPGSEPSKSEKQRGQQLTESLQGYNEGGCAPGKGPGNRGGGSHFDRLPDDYPVSGEVPR